MVTGIVDRHKRQEITTVEAVRQASYYLPDRCKEILRQALVLYEASLILPGNVEVECKLFEVCSQLPESRLFHKLFSI